LLTSAHKETQAGGPLHLEAARFFAGGPANREGRPYFFFHLQNFPPQDRFIGKGDKTQ